MTFDTGNGLGRFLSLPRRAWRRLRGHPPGDWMGDDLAPSAAARARDLSTVERHDVVVLEEAAPPPAAWQKELASSGHRVFRIGSGASNGPLYTAVETAPRLFDVAVRRESELGGLEALRLERRLGATAVVFCDASQSALAERLRVERAWPTIGAEAWKSGEDARAALREAFPKISIVVVTYGNRDLNRVCLQSLLSRTEWPNREVLVVDNASSDGTPELVSRMAADNADLRLRALDANRGFPAAANEGLRESTGAYRILLNNDTVVPRGWATALVRHLASDSGLGLVGPVTNAIANEARVDVGYDRLDEMPAWAAEWMRRHDGESFPIPMLAFFCVAMRREVLDAVGLLDERFGVGLFEDGDYCRRVRERGLEIRCARDAFVHHWQMASFRRLGRDAYMRVYEENRRKFEAKWGGGS